MGCKRTLTKKKKERNGKKRELDFVLGKKALVGFIISVANKQGDSYCQR